MGPDHSGFSGFFGGLLQSTKLDNHRGAHEEKSWKDVQCEPQPSVDEACVEEFINDSQLNQSLGPWVPIVNDCGSFAMDVITQCHSDYGDWLLQSTYGL